MELENNRTARAAYHIALVLFNLVLAAVAIAASLLYADHIRTRQLESKKADFISTVESMKSVSQNYLDSERGYVEDWAAYINHQGMTLPEALEYLRQTNTNASRFAHIVDMESYDAWSAYYPAGEEAIETYHKYHGNVVEAERTLADAMEEMFNGTSAAFSVLGRYQLQENLSPAISVGSRITLRTGTGSKDYLLLRAVPTEVLRKTWIFPAEYQSAEVGIMTRKGDYVIQSVSMKSISFPEYIRGYNFQDDYNRVDAFQHELETTDSGTLYYKNFRGEDCLWYYSSFGDSSDLDILGVITMEELHPDTSVWYIVLIICGTLGGLAVVDGLYIRRVNQRLRRTAQLAQQASQAKTQFLSAMSHDIRTPMNGVLGMMSIAQRNLDDPEYVDQCLEKAMSAGKRLLTLINDVLDISKIESGRLVLTPADVSVPEMFRDLTDMVASQVREKKLHFAASLGELPHPMVQVDPLRLNQIYINLLSNAVKYTQPGGSVEIHLCEVPLPEQPSQTRLVFRVSDTGIGMTPEFQKNMYQSFSRAVNTQVNRTQGSGLGLAIVRQMVDLMGGSILCSSAVGKGTTFTVELDLPIAAPRAAAGQEEADDTQEDVSGLHLLVAEDNDLNWEITQVLLEERGVTCQRAENGRVCVEMLVQAPAGSYDGILMDVQMPKMTGIEAARAIRALADDSRSHIPIVAMTADAFAEDVQACLDSGMNGHIAKPINGNTLQSYLRKIKHHTLTKRT